MKKFFLTTLTISMLASPVVYAAVPRKIDSSLQNDISTAQEWDKHLFTQLDDTDKKVVVSIVRPVGELFEQFEQAIDKSGESLMNAYFGLMMFYQQSAQAIAQRIDAYKKRMPVIQAISFLPSIDEIEKIIQKILPENPKNEREIKRAINKALRNKKIKQQLKKLVTEKNKQLKEYVKHIEANYADLITELDDFAEQMQNMLKNMEDNN